MIVVIHILNISIIGILPDHKNFSFPFLFPIYFYTNVATNQAEQMILDKEQISNFHIVNGRKQLEVFEDIMEELYH